MTDADLFEAFVRRYQDMVFATAVRLVGNPAEAEDVAQTVFLRAFQRFDQIASSPAASGWLKTVTRNIALNHLTRYRKRWRLFSELASKDDSGETREPIAAHATAASVTDAIEQAETNERLEQALRDLPDHQRVPLVLFHFEELSYQEIASLLRMDGTPLRFADALVRGLAAIFSVIVVGLGELWILRDPERRSWHDRIAGTYVVKVPRNWPL